MLNVAAAAAAVKSYKAVPPAWSGTGPTTESKNINSPLICK